MTHLFDPKKDFANDTGKIGQHTPKEIEQQPNTWKKIFSKLNKEKENLGSFLDEFVSGSDLNIVLTGAGSSAFVGDVVSSAWQESTGHTSQAIPTTDLVTHFKENISTSTPLLLISFARSGNSPESTAAVKRANELCDEVYHLMITCNPDGELAQMGSRENTGVFLLPPEAEDQSLAMTNSFTSMALAATLIPKIVNGETNHLEDQIKLMTSYGQKVIRKYSELLYEIAQSDFNRIIFLGSGPLWGTARESHLKVQELTNGQVVGKFDSFLGFRHGPKAIINNDTLIVYLLSNNTATNRYEKDLIRQISSHDIDLTTLGIAETDCISADIDFCITMGEKQQLDEPLWAILCTLPGQIIGFYKSLLLGYNPDNPSTDGTISRVVEGVTIYDDNPETVKN